MENPPDRTTSPPINLQSPDTKPPRRRFVQSTLFHLKPHAANNKSQNSASKEINVVDDVDNDECSGNKKRGRKPKHNSTPQKRRSKKKDVAVIPIGDMDSADDGSPIKPKEKQQRRNGRIKTPSKPVAASAPQVSQPVPHLWLEAKNTAEENSRVFAGKQLHPFFSLLRGGKKDQEVIDVEGYSCLGQRKERNAELGPIHVFEDVKDDLGSTDWSNWTFYEGPFSAAAGEMSSCEGIVGSDTGLASSLSGTSLLLRDVYSSQYLGAHKEASAVPISKSPVVVDLEVTPFNMVKNIEKELEANELGFVSDVNDSVTSTFVCQNTLQERMLSYYLNRDNQPENSLWTNKYQPEKASEVCGNSEPVKFINDWLRLWHASDSRVSNRSRNAGKSFIVDDEYDSDGYVENDDDTCELKNVLLVTGPVGSGKSAAIYACAKEQGFQVIEVNASDWRSGTLLKQKFGEAVGSHLLKRSQENPLVSQSKLTLVSSPPVLENAAQVLDLNSPPVEEIFMSEEKESVDGTGTQYRSNGRLSCDQSEIKTLILFEDVDATLCEDRGFISTIHQLANTGKRPMILTSNSENPELPDTLAREEVCFNMPSTKELIRHIYLVCAAEKATVRPRLIERCVEFCRGDIRRSLMHLQFWCQSKVFSKDWNIQSMCSPVMLSLEARHCTLPKLIPWALPSPLSEFVELEIAKSLCRVEEDQFLLDVIEEEGNVQNNLDFDKVETASIEAKKEAIIRGNCFVQVENDTTAVNSACDFSNCSGSPIAFTRRNVRRKMDTVLSSDSEEEMLSHENPAVSNGFPSDINNNLHSGANSHFHVCNPVIEDAFNEDCGPSLVSGAATVEEALHECSEATDINHISFSVSDKLFQQTTDQFVHPVEGNFSAIGHQCPQLTVPNAGEVQIEVNGIGHLLMHDVHQQFLAIDSGNQSTDQPIQFGELNIAETESQIAVNHCWNPSCDQLQQCGEAKVAVKRCLFPQTTLASSCAVECPQNQSIAGVNYCKEVCVPELQHQYPEVGVMNLLNQKPADDSLNPLCEQSPCCAETVMDHIQQQPVSSLKFSSYPPLDGSINPVEAAVKDIQQQHCPQAGDQHQSIYSATISKVEEIQQQCSGSLDLNNAPCLPIDVPFKHTSNELHMKETQRESGLDQSPKTSNVCLAGCSANTNNCTSPSNWRKLKLIEAKAEEQQHQWSEATNLNCIDRCQSIDVSCVPESTFVPETVIDDGAEFQSERDMMDIVSPVTFDNYDRSIFRNEAPENGLCGSDMNVPGSNEEMGDSQSEDENLEASTSGCQVMDECSRMDFCTRSKCLKNSRLDAKNVVQERLNELQLMDLRQHISSEHKNVQEVLDLTYGLINIISEGDLLLHDFEFVIDDYQDIGISEETFSFSWHDQHVLMGLAVAEHGYCLYAKDVDALRSNMGTDCEVHQLLDLRTTTNQVPRLGEPLRFNRSETSLDSKSSKPGATTVDTSFMRERKMFLQNIVQSITPARCYLALRENSLHDYLSSLAHISRSEALRLAEAASKMKRRRVRGAKNYLSSGALDLSPDDISLLNVCSCYGKSFDLT